MLYSISLDLSSATAAANTTFSLYVGAVAFEKGNVTLAFVQVATNGYFNPVPVAVPNTECHRCWFGAECCSSFNLHSVQYQVQWPLQSCHRPLSTSQLSDSLFLCVFGCVSHSTEAHPHLN
jgi:hypothetical protein